WSTKHSGMTERLSRLTNTTHLPNGVITVDIFLTSFRWIFATGCVPSARCPMTGTSTRYATCWPQGLRWLPSESGQDRDGRKLAPAPLSEQGTHTREGGNPASVYGAGGCPDKIIMQ